jgi:hypothetical protein
MSPFPDKSGRGNANRFVGSLLAPGNAEGLLFAWGTGARAFGG